MLLEIKGTINSSVNKIENDSFERTKKYNEYQHNWNIRNNAYSSLLSFPYESKESLYALIISFRKYIYHFPYKEEIYNWAKYDVTGNN